MAWVNAMGVLSSRMNERWLSIILAFHLKPHYIAMNSVIMTMFFGILSLITFESVICNLSSSLYLATDFPASKWQSSDVLTKDNVKTIFDCANICTITSCNLWKYSAEQLTCELSDVIIEREVLSSSRPQQMLNNSSQNARIFFPPFR